MKLEVLKAELFSELQKLKEQESRLAVKWEAGGDQTIVNFSLEDSNKLLNGEIYSGLRSYLIEELNLPNAGEHYNDGEGRIFKEGNSIVLIYDEFAYHEKDHETESLVDEDIKIPHEMDMNDILMGSKSSEIHFEGEVAFMAKKVSYFYAGGLDRNDFSRKFIEEMQRKIEPVAVSKFDKSNDAIQICYSGRVGLSQIVLEELHRFKYVVDRHAKQRRTYLLLE